MKEQKGPFRKRDEWAAEYAATFKGCRVDPYDIECACKAAWEARGKADAAVVFSQVRDQNLRGSLIFGIEALNK